MLANAGMHFVAVCAPQVVIENDYFGLELLDRIEDVPGIVKRLDDGAAIAKQLGQCARDMRVVVDQKHTNVIKLAQCLPSPFSKER